MEPDRDYSYAFSNSHAASIRGVCSNQIVAACVASDLLDKVVAAEKLEDGKYRVIYTSQRFPSAAFGYAHNLHPQLAEAIREILVKFEFPTEMRNEFGTSGERRFVAISYRDDWDLIRGIDDALGTKYDDHGSVPADEMKSPPDESDEAVEEEQPAAGTAG